MRTTTTTMLAALRGTASVGASSRLTGRRRLAVQAGQTPCLSRRSCVAGTGGVWPAAAQLQQQQRRHESAHAISNPTLAGIEKRWEEMPPQEQANLWMALRDRMKTDWKELTAHEKKAAYWIAFGPHGPRAKPPADQTWQVVKTVAQALLVSLALFGLTRYFAKPAPRTMTREWQEASNEYLKEQNVEPITGISSPDYKGRGMVQSGPAKKE